MSGPISTNLDRIFSRCEGAYSRITLRGYRSDFVQFLSWCERGGWPALPASPEAIAGFIDDQSPLLALATLKRRLCAIQFVHRMSDQPSPLSGSAVQLALRRAARARSRRPKQSAGLTSGLLQDMLAACPPTLAGLRDSALLSVGYDTLCRSAELAAMRIEHLFPAGGYVVIPRSKADQYGEGRTAYLSPAAWARLEAWLRTAGLGSGPVFRSLHTGRPLPTPLETSSIRRLVKRAARRAGVDPGLARSLSGHSLRIGAAQDMMVAGCDTVGIMQAGGWRTHAVLARYVENAMAEQLHIRRWERIRSTSDETPAPLLLPPTQLRLL